MKIEDEEGGNIDFSEGKLNENYKKGKQFVKNTKKAKYKKSK